MPVKAFYMRPTPTAPGPGVLPPAGHGWPPSSVFGWYFQARDLQLSSCLAHLTSLMSEEALSMDLGKYAHQQQGIFLLDPVLRTRGFSEKLCPHIKALALINSGLWENLGRAMVK